MRLKSVNSLPHNAEQWGQNSYMTDEEKKKK